MQTKLVELVVVLSALLQLKPFPGVLPDGEAMSRCARVAAPAPASWPVVELTGSRRMVISIPPGSERVGGASCFHGCERWQRGSLQLDVSHGLWGLGSFDERSVDRACRRDLAGIIRIEMPGRSRGSLTVWPVPDETHFSDEDFYIEASWSNDRDRRDAFRALDSLRLAP